MTAIAERLEEQQGTEPTVLEEPAVNGFGGWADWAEWIEPVERSLAAVSASALEDRVERLYTRGPERICPAATHVLAMIDLGDSRSEVPARKRRLLIMRRLRDHFPFVEAVAAVTPTRYAVLARRHSGLAGTLSTLEHRLRSEANDLGSVAAVWCEPLPEDPGDIAAMMRGLRIVPRMAHQDERAALAGGSSLEVLAGIEATAAPDDDSAKSSVAHWAAHSMITALACAILMSALGVGAITTSVHPWQGSEVASTNATSTTANIDAGRGVMSVLAPGAPALLDHARGWLRDASAQDLIDEDVANEPAPSPPTAPDLTVLPDPDPAVASPASPEAPAAPAAPETPEAPDEPELPLPEPQNPEPLPIPQTEPPPEPPSEPLLPEVPLVDGVVDDVTHEVDGAVDEVTDTLPD